MIHKKWSAFSHDYYLFLPLLAVVIVSVVMGILVAVALVVILALLAVVLKQRKHIQKLTMAPSFHVPPQPAYEDIADVIGKQNIELTRNVAYGQVKN